MRHFPPPTTTARRGLVLVVGLLLAAQADAQLRVVSYNTAGGPRSEMEIIFRAIGEETRNGFAKPIDVLLVQEQTSWSSTTQSIVNMLNGMYGTGAYGLAMLDGDTMGSGRPGLVYNTTTVQLIDTIAFGDVGGSGAARQTLRYQLRPFGYDGSADFYAYNSHYKADTGSANEQRRLAEATAIRQNADALGAGAHIIYAGDFNMYRGSEPGFQMLVGAGAGQAFDPVDRIGDWTFNSSFADVHTQSPCATSCTMVGGGMDDRFDFQLVTGEFLDGQGLDYIPGSYRAFGNNGSTFDTDINAPSNTYVFSGVSSYTQNQILDALKAASDHIPVIADYQLPDGDPPPQPGVIAQWTFENSGSSISGTGGTFGPISPEAGTGAARGVHANASTAWSSPAGNGSTESFSSNNWAVGDYYQFQTSTAGLENISLQFDQVSSGTGPRDFQLRYSTDGSTFGDFGSAYMVRENDNPNWSASSPVPGGLDTYTFDLSSITALDNQSNIYFRLVMATTTSASGSTVGSGGTNRVDNVTIIGTPMVGLAGDFNGDGMVDAADYVVWRKNGGTTEQYDTWRMNFGATSAGSGSVAAAAVPEPAALLLAVAAVCLAALRRGTLRA